LNGALLNAALVASKEGQKKENLGTRYTYSRQQIDAGFPGNMSLIKTRRKMPDYALSYAGVTSSPPALPSVSQTPHDSVSSTVQWGHALTTLALTTLALTR